MAAQRLRRVRYRPVTGCGALPQRSAGRDSDMNAGTHDRIVRRDCPDLAATLHPHPVIHRVLAARGVTQASELHYALADLPRPDTLTDIVVAIERLLQARMQGEHVLVVGDYDCDGATSTALAVLALREMGFTSVDFLVPNRFEYGYGLSPAIVELAAGEGSRKPDLILTVDNGVASVEGVARARHLGIDVLVTDHHLPPDELPRAAAIVNPNLPGARFPGRNLAGVGVVFYVMLALRRRLLDESLLTTDVNLARYLDLVALGTVADVVPLDAVNRTLVEQGLRRIRAGQTRPGVAALIACAGRSVERFSATDIGFAVGPRINAAGRIDDMRIGIRCLISDCPDEARALASELDALNRQRRQIEQGMREEADGAVQRLLGEQGESEGVFGVALYDSSWHQGVIGILAGRLKEALHRPVVIFTEDTGTRLIKGSARSIAGVHIRDVLDAIATRRPALIERFGGHAMAAGLSVQARYFDEFAAAFDREIATRLDRRLPARQWLSDGSLSGTELGFDTAQLLQTVGPWGQGFDMPQFDNVFVVRDCRLVGKGHLKLRLALSDSGDDRVPSVDAMVFNRAEALQPGSRIQALYQLLINEYRGHQSLQLNVLYLRELVD